MPNVPPPPTTGLAIGANYILYSPNGSNCAPITGLKITITVTEDIVWQSSPQGGGQGFGFQLNAFSPIGTTLVPGPLNAVFPPPVTNIIPGWQQFVFSIDTANPGQTDFSGEFENWPASPSFAAFANPSPPPAYLTGSDLINIEQDAGVLATNGIAGIPAGFELVISLGTDGGNNVNSVTFSATNKNDSSVPPVSTTITPLDPSPGGTVPQQLDSSLPPNRLGAIQQEDLAPIVAFQLVLVGLAGNQALLSSGEGTIAYEASVPLTVLGTPPPCISFTLTGEGANTVYGQIPQGATTPVAQSFAVTPATWTSTNGYQPAPASCSFILRRTTFGKDEVAEMIATGGAVFQQAFFVTVQGLKPTDFRGYNGGAGITELISSSQTPTQQQLDELKTWAPSIGAIYDVNNKPTNIAVQATAVSSDDPLFGPQAQTFTFTYSITFPDESAFTSLPASDYPEWLTLDAWLIPTPVPAGPLTVSGSTLMAQAQIELITSADPFFSSEANGGLSWLSEDLRAFYVEENGTLFGLTLGSAQAPTPLSFIQQVVSGMKGRNGSVPGSSDTFEKLPHAAGQDSELSLLATTANGKTLVYNFALARVRLTGVSETAPKVRVFFRTWQAQTTAVTYTTPAAGAGPSPATGPFRQYSDGVEHGRTVPLLGLSSDGMEYITVPFLGTGRVPPGTDMTTQPEDSPYNAKPMSPPTRGGTAYAYFGAWLDTNQGTKQFPLQPPATNPDGEDNSFNALVFGTISTLFKGLHQCLAAEIVDDDAPITDNATPATSDKIAQRNLAFSVIANPGVSESRLTTHTFEITPSVTGFNADQRPDELMIDWRNVPAGSVASIYLPAVKVSDIVALADAMYFTHDLHVSDPHTLHCRTGGINYVPVPKGSGANYAGLFSVQLPTGVRRGQAFEIVVHQVTGVARDKDSNVVAIGAGSRQARRIRGSFQIAIPVSTKAEMLVPEERGLSIMKWVQETIPESSRWYPVFLRYIEQLSNRVTALGGDGNLVPPTRTGTWPGLLKTGLGEGHHTHARRECTGKVDAIVYDHFGEFKAFLIETFEGERRRFESHEAAVLELVQKAWEKRIPTTVISSDDHPERLVEIILHGSSAA